MSTNITINLTFCGFPTFCSLDAIEQCREMPLRYCPACRPSLATGAFVIMLIVGLLIVAGNLFVIAITVGMDKQKRTKRDYCKISLALADVLKGISTLALICPNILWTLNTSVVQLHTRRELSRGSVYATFWGVLSLFLYTSSLYHLLYMSIQRFMAIHCPFYYRQITFHQTRLHLAAVWVASITSASILAWKDSAQNFTYNVLLYQYFFDITENAVTIVEIIPLIIFFLLPSLAMTLLTIVTTHLACFRLRKSNSLRGVHSDKKTVKREIAMFRITFAMNLGYSIGVVPCVAVMASIASGILNCATLSRPFLACFYASFSTGLINVLIYSVFDKHFRSSVTEIYERKVLRKQKRQVTMMSMKTRSTKITEVS